MSDDINTAIQQATQLPQFRTLEQEQCALHHILHEHPQLVDLYALDDVEWRSLNFFIRYLQSYETERPQFPLDCSTVQLMLQFLTCSVPFDKTGARAIADVVNLYALYPCPSRKIANAAKEVLCSINYHPSPSYEAAMHHVIATPFVIDKRPTEWSQNYETLRDVIVPHLSTFLAQYPQQHHLWIYHEDKIITVTPMSHRLCLGVAVKVCSFYMGSSGNDVLHTCREQWDLFTPAQARLFLPNTPTRLAELSAMVRQRYSQEVEAHLGRDPTSIIMTYFLPRDVLDDTCCASYMATDE